MGAGSNRNAGKRGEASFRGLGPGRAGVGRVRSAAVISTQGGRPAVAARFGLGRRVDD